LPVTFTPIRMRLATSAIEASVVHASKTGSVGSNWYQPVAERTSGMK